MARFGRSFPRPATVVRRRPALGGITATASITEASDTLSAAARLALKAALARTEASDTLAAHGALQIKGALSAVEENDTLAASSSGNPIFGEASLYEEDDSALAVALLAIAGIVEVTEGNDTLTTDTFMWAPLYPPAGNWVEQSASGTWPPQETGTTSWTNVG